MNLMDIKKRRKFLSDLKADINQEIQYGVMNDEILIKETKIENERYKIATIVDEFTYLSLRGECELLQLSPSKWERESVLYQPNLLFIESAWYGKDKLWSSKISMLTQETIDLLNWYRDKHIPIVFWNKEDPVHFETFLPIAQYADFVFTTDFSCISNYKSSLQHNNVFLMPFAVQPRLHNPIRYDNETRLDKFCFAGAYYREFPERCISLVKMLKTVETIGNLDIFDRGLAGKKYIPSFPKKFRKYIKGSLKASEISVAYRGYRFHINLNTVKQSQTMCARRVFELIASNTLVVSDYSRALKLLFGDLVISTDNPKIMQEQIKKMNDRLYESKIKLLALRKVLMEHTYSHRLNYITSKVFGTNEIKSESVLTIAVVDTIADYSRVLDIFDNQIYSNKHLIILSALKLEVHNVSVTLLTFEEWNQKIQNFRAEYDYWAFFSSDDYYSSNYLTDLILGYAYVNEKADIVGKAAFYSQQQDGQILCSNNQLEYIRVPTIATRRALLRPKNIPVDILKSASIEINTFYFSGNFIVSLDSLNYCENYRHEKCDMVDDIKISDSGILLDKVIRNSEEVLDDINLEVNISKSKILLITDHYPNYDDLYRNAFIHRRVVEYKKQGLIVDVFKSNEDVSLLSYEYNGINIRQGGLRELISAIGNMEYQTVVVHFLTDLIWRTIKENLLNRRLIIWVHGVEIQAYWRRSSSKMIDQLAEDKWLQKKAHWLEVFKTINQKKLNIHCVFISRYLAETSFEDIGYRIDSQKYSIIHNFIDADLFKYQFKKTQQRLMVLSIRPYESEIYANDLLVGAILNMSKLKIFKEFTFKLIGKGRLFKKTTSPLRKFRNVILEERFCSQEEIASIHKSYGVFLVPSRSDTQGVSRDEAMSSGLVPITNYVAAIPEFVDQTCGILVEQEDTKALVNALENLYYNPQLYSQLSKHASERVVGQSGYNQTLFKELLLLK